MSIIRKLFEKSDEEVVRILLDDSSSHLTMSQRIGQNLLLSEDFIEDDCWMQIYSIVTLAPFANSEQECSQVTEIIRWGASKTDVMPSIIEHRKEELAYRCLISLSFYKKRMEQKTKRHGAPSVNFYRNIGTHEFKSLGKDDISEHFYQWEGFLAEFFHS
jgi:hypothetical protein